MPPACRTLQVALEGTTMNAIISAAAVRVFHARRLMFALIGAGLGFISAAALFLPHTTGLLGVSL